MKNEWADIIPSYFKDKKGYLIHYCPKPEHILIVEGKTDFEFYHRLMEKSYFTYGVGKKCTLNITKRQIWFNGQDGKGPILAKYDNTYKNKYEGKKSEKPNYGYAYDFVIECIKYSKNPEIKKKYSCYGIIDNDFGQHNNDIIALENISKNIYHDRESSLLYYYLPTYYECIDEIKKDDAISKSAIAIRACFEQGLIEEASLIAESIWKSDDESESIKKLKKITKHFFNDNKTKPCFTITDFVDYIETCTNRPEFCSLFQNELQKKIFDEKIFRDYKEIYFDLRSKELSKENDENFVEIIRNWLTHCSGDIKAIESFFKKCNGHYLINQLLLLGNDLFRFKDEEEFVNFILEEIILNRYEYVNYFEKDPLMQYKQYRMENGYIAIQS